MATIECPHCKSQFSVSEEKVANITGKNVACKKCAKRFVIAVDTPQPTLKVEQVTQSQKCPKCDYTRQSSDDDLTPKWQCPKCAVAYVKSKGYYYKDGNGNVLGPYSKQEIIRLIKDKIIILSFSISSDKKRWIVAAKLVKTDLFDIHEFTKKDTNQYSAQVNLYLDFFVRTENYKDTIYLIKELKFLLGRLTAPREFIVANITKSGTSYTKHDLIHGTSNAIAEADAVRFIDQGIESNNYKTASIALSKICGGIGLISGYWSIANGEVTAYIVLAGSIIATILSFLGFVNQARKQTFVGYVLDDTATKMLTQANSILAHLRRCGGVWTFSSNTLDKQKKFNWKYNAGDSFTVSKIPLTVFNKNLPNIQTNIGVPGITCSNVAIYFLPSRLLVLVNGKSKRLDYSEVHTDRDTFIFVEQSGKTYHDSRVLDMKWLYINKDGSRDRRFKDNRQLPRVECGVLKLKLGQYSDIEMLMSDPDLPKIFIDEFNQFLSTPHTVGINTKP